jgi:hypothetical protein
VDRIFDAVVAATALIAVILTYSTIRLQRHGNRDQTFLRIHEILMGDDMRLGRSLLIEAGKTEKVPELASDEYRQMTHALGGLETAGIYIDQGLMSRERFIAIWHHSLRAMRVGADLMADHRMEELEGWWPWPRLWSLFHDASSFHDNRMICCRHEGRWPSSSTAHHPAE